MLTKKIIWLFALSTLLSLPILSYGSTKISSVSLKIDTEDEEDTIGMPELSITTKNNNYSVDGYEITIGLDGEAYDESHGAADSQNEASGPGATSLNNSDEINQVKKSTEPATCEIALSADDDYYFYTMSKKDIKISGLDANCTKASRQDSGKTLVLTVQLPGIKSMVGYVSEAGWEDTAIATWDQATNASTYEIRLYRDGKSTGKVYETNARKFNFAPLMLRDGEYSYSVKGVATDGRSGKKAGSDITIITTEISEEFKKSYALKYEAAEEGSGPSTGRVLLNGGWQLNVEKYWYRLDDGMYPQAMWLTLGDDWYWFDSDGTMVSEQWISWKEKEYYFGSDGKMLKNTKTPDSHTVNSYGAKIN